MKSDNRQWNFNKFYFLNSPSRHSRTPFGRFYRVLYLNGLLNDVRTSKVGRHRRKSLGCHVEGSRTVVLRQGCQGEDLNFRRTQYYDYNIVSEFGRSSNEGRIHRRQCIRQVLQISQVPGVRIKQLEGELCTEVEYQVEIEDGSVQIRSIVLPSVLPGPVWCKRKIPVIGLPHEQ